MAGPSNSPPYDSPGKQELHYLHAINVNFSNFVSVKLSGNDNYHLWKTQMLCLMETHNMRSLVDGPFDRSSSIMKQYDSLLKGWIFGSVSQRVLGTVVDLGSAKDVWDKLKSFYAPNISFQQVKLSGNDNYHLWKTQMLCLMETHNMRSLVDDPLDRSSSIMNQCDSLLKGWIFGSVSQRVLGTVVDLGSAKEVWDKLKSFYAPYISFQQCIPYQIKQSNFNL